MVESGAALQRTRAATFAFALILFAALLLFLLEFENRKIGEHELFLGLFFLLRFCLHDSKVPALIALDNTVKR